MKPNLKSHVNSSYFVTPRAGVWIETSVRSMPYASNPSSLPVRECGLKPTPAFLPDAPNLVTPRAGVWIETHIYVIL